MGLQLHLPGKGQAFLPLPQGHQVLSPKGKGRAGVRLGSGYLVPSRSNPELGNGGRGKARGYHPLDGYLQLQAEQPAHRGAKLPDQIRSPLGMEAPGKDGGEGPVLTGLQSLPRKFTESHGEKQLKIKNEVYADHFFLCIVHGEITAIYIQTFAFSASFAVKKVCQKNNILKNCSPEQLRNYRKITMSFPLEFFNANR